MKLFKIYLFISFFISFSFSQNLQKPSKSEILTLPLWAQKMYSENSNVLEVDSLYLNYYRKFPFIKNYHTQYYKRWKRKCELNFSNVANSQYNNISKEKINNINKSTSWTVVGPIYNQGENGSNGSGQTNVYCIDQCLSSQNILYCGTEPGEVFKSIDNGNNWFCVSLNENFGSGVTAIEVNPVNPEIVIAGGNFGLFLSINGGNTWQNNMPTNDLGVNEIMFSSNNLQKVYAATDKGLFVSNDGGSSWSIEFINKTYDIKEKPGDATTLYCLRNLLDQNKAEFYRSNDSGVTWENQISGWYNSNDPNRNDGGGRIAVTPADPNRVYCYLIGEAKANDYGFIGVFRSDDSGSSWILPNSPAGGPYSESHPNLAIGSPDWTYHQGFYNCAILCSETNPDEIIIGGLNIWKSIDGAQTFTGINGYIGGQLNLHVDNQDFRAINGNYWFTTDGGIYFSNNLLDNQPEFKMRGVRGSDYWGFGSGWNEDVLVGGLYHNGNLAYHENYGSGNFLELGGGEAPTGYVNPGNNRKTYFSDIDGQLLPQNINDQIVSFSTSKSPNESYYAAESSEMEFHPNCYQIIILGNENKLWKSENGGSEYYLLKEFGTNPNDGIRYIEWSSSNPSVIYLNQQMSNGSAGKLWKSTDSGLSWNSLTIPSGQSRRMLIALNPENENELWIAYPDVYIGNKVFHSVNGGISWDNYSDAMLNGDYIQNICYIAGTNGGLYVATNKTVYYRNSNTSWVLDNESLPTFINGNILKPFYRDNKIRLASYGKGIWEGNLFEAPSHPIARIMVDKLKQDAICKIDSFYFEDYSFLNHYGASWSWSFPTGSPSTSNVRNPVVYFAQVGTHKAILTITNQQGQFDSDTIEVQVNQLTAPSLVQESFEGSFLPSFWEQGKQNTGSWAQTSVGSYGNSTKSAFFDNYNIYGEGNKSDLLVNYYINGTAETTLKFDVSYARWGEVNSDTLEILISLDCGNTFQSVYRKGGTELATSPDFQDFFIPTFTQWKTETVSLGNLSQKVIVVFRNIGRYGNAIYLDQINISNTLGGEVLKFNQSINIYPNPTCAGEYINFEHLNEKCQVKIINQNGKIIAKYPEVKNQINLPTTLSSGVYIIQIETENFIYNKKIILEK